jgi:Tfp pilus assembly protein PilV
MNFKLGRSTRQRPAFTLAEVLLALALAVVAVMSAIALGVSSMQGNQKITDQATATSLGYQEIERFIYGAPNITDPFWTQTNYSRPYQTDQVTLGSTPFDADLFVDDLTSIGAGSDLKRVVLNVSWNSGAVGKAGSGQQVIQVERLLYAH